MTLIFVLALLVLLSAASYHRASWNTALGIAAVTMLVGTFAGAFGIISWLIFLAIVIPLSVTNLRQQYIVAPAFKAFKKVTPTMSETEKSAIDAGTTWWEADLFCGNPNWDKLHQFPKPRLSVEEQDDNNNIVSTNYSDYRDVNGIKFPFNTEIPSQKLELNIILGFF